MVANFSLVNATTIANNPSSNTYDSSGAMIYIVIVLLWYSIGIIFMLGMQMRARTERTEDSTRRRTKILIRNLRNHTNTKEILEELVDKEKRARLWDIYLGTEVKTTDKLTRAESVRIRHIEKQLATINRNRRLTNETLFPPEPEVRCYRSRSDSRQVTSESTPVEVHSTLHRRRSSFDQQTLERWKALSNQSKTHEQMPWTIRKLMIGRYFRRPPKKSSLAVIRQDSQGSAVTEDLLSFTNHINLLTRTQTELNLEQMASNDERQNPYLTYFYLPTDRPSILNSEFFPLPNE